MARAALTRSKSSEGPLLRRLLTRFLLRAAKVSASHRRLLSLLMLAVPPLWLAAYLAGLALGNGQGGAWPVMIAGGLLLALPLSIPIVGWVLTIFRVHVVQSLLFVAAMIALIADVVAGPTPAAWLALPVGYVASYLLQLAGGWLIVRRLRADALRFGPLDAHERDVVLVAGYDTREQELVASGRCARVFVAAQGIGGRIRLIEPIAAEDGAAILELGEGKPPRGWTLLRSRAGYILMRPADALPAEAIVLERRTFRAPAGLIVGKLVKWSIRDGARRWNVVRGTGGVVAWPLVTLFFWSAVAARGYWVVGFGRRAVTLGSAGIDPTELLMAHEPRLSAKSAALIRIAHDAFVEDERLETERRHQREAFRRDRAHQRPRTVTVDKRGRRVSIEVGSSEDDLWRAVAADPRTWQGHTDAYGRVLAARESFDRETLRRALNWIEAAIPLHARDSLTAAARLLAVMPETLLASDYPRLLAIFNSRALGMVWRLTDDFDRTPLPPSVPVFGDEAGFGLIRSVPELYLKLSPLGPEMEEIVIGLAEEAARYGISLPDALDAMARPPSATR